MSGSDGTGRDGYVAAAAHIMTRRPGEAPETRGIYLGTKVNVADAGRAGILRALELTRNQDQLPQHLGPNRRLEQAATERDMRQASKATRQQQRQNQAYGLGRCTDWPRRALSAYTWMRTNKRPQRRWLHHIGKAGGKECSCGHDTQDGHHFTFLCPLYETTKRRLIGARESDSWESLDKPLLIKGREEGREHYADGVELFFLYIFAQLT